MIIPVGHRILVKPKELVEVTEGGIILVQDKKREEQGQTIGTLLDYGPQAWRAFDREYKGLPWASIGDRVVYSKYVGTQIKDPDTEEILVILNDDDIIAIIKEGNKKDNE